MNIQHNIKNHALVCNIDLSELYYAGFTAEDIVDERVRDSIMESVLELSARNNIDLSTLQTVDVSIWEDDIKLAGFKARLVKTEKIEKIEKEPSSTLPFKVKSLSIVSECLKLIKSLGVNKASVYKYNNEYVIVAKVKDSNKVKVSTALAEYGECVYDFMPEHARLLTTNMDFLCEGV